METYLYGDSTLSPFQHDFIAFLPEAIDFIVQALLCDSRIDDALQRAAQLATRRSRLRPRPLANARLFRRSRRVPRCKPSVEQGNHHGYRAVGGGCYSFGVNASPEKQRQKAVEFACVESVAQAMGCKAVPDEANQWPDGWLEHADAEREPGGRGCGASPQRSALSDHGSSSRRSGSSTTMATHP
jgi:hypothetical protein